MSNSNSESFLLIQTKLHRPPLPRDLVARPRLTDLLDCQPQRPLTLVSAPAGYGKSTLISRWAGALDCPVAWVSLDEHDSDIVLFISYLVAALQTIFPTAGADTWVLIHGSDLPPLAAISRTLINELDQIEADFVLVLDDYHRIRSTSIHNFIEELLTHPPRHLHLVLGTRIDPPISLNNLRARHGLAGLNNWMKAHEKSMEITVAIIFGLLFLVIGLEHIGVF